MPLPLVSVIIPAHNGARWLDECLGSVLRQTYANTEILVIDDGSTDTTPQLLARYQPRIRVVRQPQAGIGAARNRGLEQARGELLAFLDQDDRWRAHKLERQVSHLLGHPEQAVLYSDAEEFGEQGVIHRSFLDLFPRLRRPERLFEAMIDLAVPLMSTVLIRQSFLKQRRITFYEPASGVDDVGLLLEIASQGGRFGCLDEVLTERRLHEQNLSKCHYNRFEKRVRLYRALLEKPHDPPWRHALRRGLRDAHFRVAEWHWGRLELEAARQHFRQARGLDAQGLRAVGLHLASRLPRPLLCRLRQAKQALVG